MSEEKKTVTEATALELKEGQEITGTITRLTLYGPMVDISSGQDALLHISQLGDAETINPGEEVTAYVLRVDNERGRVVLTLEKPPRLSWSDIQPDAVFQGQVIRIENFGVFVDIGAERPGMVHVSEMADDFVKSPEDVVSMGQEVQVRVLKVDHRKKQIDLTMKSEAVHQIEIDETEEDYEMLTAMEAAFRRAQEGNQTKKLKEEADRAREREAEKRRRERESILQRTLRSQSQ